MAKNPDLYDRVKRRGRMDANNAKDTYPTSEGDRKLALKKPSTLQLLKGKPREVVGDALTGANKFRKLTDSAAEGINERKKLKKME